MKRRFKVLMALVMSLTMMFGMSTTAYAGYTGGGYYYPDQVYACDEGIPGSALFYVSAINNRGDVLTIYYNSDGTLNEASDDNAHWKGKWIFQGGDPIIGRVYYPVSASSYCLDNNHNSEPYLAPAPSQNPGSDDETSLSHSCAHDFVWQTITAPTTTYGTEGDVCSKCGATRNVRVKSPLDDWVRMQINNAKPGDVLNLNFGSWNSYPLWMMQMIADKPTVTYIFNYTYQGNKYEVTIKPGDKFALDCEWYGPAKMPTLFDTVITKW